MFLNSKGHSRLSDIPMWDLIKIVFVFLIAGPLILLNKVVELMKAWCLRLLDTLRQRKGHASFNIFALIPLFFLAPLYLAVSWPEYVLFLITRNENISVLNFLLTYIFTDLNNEWIELLVFGIASAIWIFVWIALYSFAMKKWMERRRDK